MNRQSPSRRRWSLATAAAAVLVGAASPAVGVEPAEAPQPPGLAEERDSAGNLKGTPRKDVDKDQRYDLTVSAPQGTVSAVTLDGLTEITQGRVTHRDPRADGIVITAEQAGLSVSVPASQKPGRYMFQATGTGCAGDVCDVKFTVKMTLNVVPPQPVPPGAETFTSASADRIAAGEPLQSGGVALRDELTVTLGTPDAPGTRAQADVLAALVGAMVTGGIEPVGIYEFRWTGPADLAAATAALRADGRVTAVSRSNYGISLLEEKVPSGDWNDDGVEALWAFDQIRATQAWDITTGGDVPVGILDGGTVWPGHEDLSDDLTILGPRGDAGHATHVAGIACAQENGKGLVGVSWGCPLVSTGLTDTSDKGVLQSAYAMQKSGVKVVNMSLGFQKPEPEDENAPFEKCMTDPEGGQMLADHAGMDLAWRQIMNGVSGGRDMVWVISAGNNCLPYVTSPWQRNYGLPNVLTVASTNSDARLSSFSTSGPQVEVAAPGGVHTRQPGWGVWSTLFTEDGCGFGWAWPCSTYGPTVGTSMAAPHVTGIAALMRSVDSTLSAADIGSCITATAGRRTPDVGPRSALPTKLRRTSFTPVVGESIEGLRIVDAEAAVKCARDGLTGGGILILGAGDRTASGDGSDLGDLVQRLTEAQFEVSTSRTMPDDLSGFEQVWHIDTQALPDSEVARLVDFIDDGKGVYLTGEWGCCPVDRSTLSVINQVTAGGVTHGGTVGTTFDAVVRPTATGQIGTMPYALTTLRLSASGSLRGVPPESVVAEAPGDPSRAVWAAWDSHQVDGGGKVVALMDINWMAHQYRDHEQWHRAARNIAEFLS